MLFVKFLPGRFSWMNRVTLGFVCGVLALSAGCASSQDPDEVEDQALNSSEFQSADGGGNQRLTAENNAAEQDFSRQPAAVESGSPEMTPPPVPEESAIVAEGSAETSRPDALPEESAVAVQEDLAGASASAADQSKVRTEEQTRAQTEAPQTSEEVAVVDAAEQLATEAPPEPAVIEAVPAMAEPANAESAELGPAVVAEDQSEPAIPPTPEPIRGALEPKDRRPKATTRRERKQTAAAAPAQTEVSRQEVPAWGAATGEPRDGGQIEYLVAPGDSLIEIATRIYGSAREWQTIARANGLQAPFVIYPGDVLNIKLLGSASAFAQAYKSAPETQITVQKGDTLSSISQRLLGTATAWKYIWKINESALPNPNQLRPGQTIRFRDYRGIQANL